MRIAIGCLVLLGAAACGEARPLSEADKAAIRAATDSFVARARDRRDSATAELFTANAVFMPPNQGPVEGRAAIRAWLESFPPMTAFTATVIDVDGRGDIAYVRGTYALTIAAAEGRPAIEDRGKYLEIRRREGGREWRTAIDIFNSDLPPPPPPPAPPAPPARRR